MFSRPGESLRPGPSRKVWGVLRKYDVDGCLLLPLGHCILALKFVALLAELDHNRLPLGAGLR